MLISELYYTTSQIAKIANLSRQRIAQFARANKIIKFGNHYVFTEDDLKKIVERKGACGQPKKNKNNLDGDY